MRLRNALARVLLGLVWLALMLDTLAVLIWGMIIEGRGAKGPNHLTGRVIEWPAGGHNAFVSKSELATMAALSAPCPLFLALGAFVHLVRFIRGSPVR
jgi:hypothetical protein